MDSNVRVVSASEMPLALLDGVGPAINLLDALEDLGKRARAQQLEKEQHD
jgi:hypothetical protein